MCGTQLTRRLGISSVIRIFDSALTSLAGNGLSTRLGASLGLRLGGVAVDVSVGRVDGRGGDVLDGLHDYRSRRVFMLVCKR